MYVCTVNAEYFVVQYFACLIFAAQATCLFLVALLTHHRQIFVRLIFLNQATHENFPLHNVHIHVHVFKRM